MLPFVKPYWVRALIAVCITIPIGAMDAVIAWSLKPYMDVVMFEQRASSLEMSLIPLLIIAFSSCQSLMNYVATYLNTWVGQKITQDVKIRLFDKLLHYNAAFFDTKNSGDILYRFNKDADSACGGLLSNMKLFTTRLFSSLALIGVLFYNSWQLAIVAVIVLLGALYPLTTVRKKIKSIMDKTVFSGSAVITHYNEAFNGNRVVTSYNLYDYLNFRFKETLRSVFKLGMKMVQRTGMMSPMMHFIVSLGIAAVIWLGSYLIVTKQITPGNFVSFITALIMLYNPIKSIGNNFNSVQMSFLAMDRMFKILESVPNIHNRDHAKPLKKVKDFIEYKDVCFEYIEGRPVLKNINLKIKCGQTIAFVGNSGGGKTTLVNLLPRFYDITSGSITIDGQDVRDFELNSLRAQIAIVFQDNFLFSGTIRENILLGRDDVSPKQINAAIKAACLEEFIAGLELGLDTQIGERGVLLSGGQKQRIAIARAFIKNAPIVILDEATSALDNKSEAVVQQAIDNLMKDRTVFIIAHRLSTVKNADKIVVVNYGEIVESGTHDQLLKKENSIYGSLYKTQLK
ncbi:MAG: ATP-binding cassette domain-containing protein [Alphaproteobacteria bacterium]|nr:ATP-binding cassette domain-containing protein [Alphaproteobacteria bacterium]MBQ9235553.1 ATP-binding cassette domain-containing protein [Alphaproteobacteria bacterium]